MNERENPAALWPTYALRAWLAALISETRRSQLEVDARIEHYEKEIARLHKQKERSTKVIESLRESIGIVDSVLRRVLDTDVNKEERAREGEKHQESEGHRDESKKEERAGAKMHPPEKRAR